MEYEEEWRTVRWNDEVFNDYEVSNYGRIRSLNYRGHGTTQVLKLHENVNGYLSVRLSKNGKRKTYLVHRVVAFTWIPNDEPTVKTIVNHKNELKHDCRVENLEWCTQRHNVQHGTSLERRTKTQTNDPNRSKRVLCVETGVIYPSANECSRQLKIPQGNISGVCNGKTKSTHGFHFVYVD